ncbi:MAG TPA: hypothetical protein VKZ63_04545, partial [Kofleriaceae bacterium]|nr:hypothetical protein [Kofleriaceae bacterium]
DSGRRMRAGERDAWDQQRKLLARLHERAAAALAEHGHSANQAVLRRVSTTLQALSAAGSWDPDTPGQLSEERAAPGFEAALGAAPLPPLVPHPHETPARAAERAVEEEKARRRQRTMERTLAQARASAAQHRVSRLRAELARAEEALAQQREELRAAEEELARALAEIEAME